MPISRLPAFPAALLSGSTLLLALAASLAGSGHGN
jgi:hypothetical protein